MMGTRNLPGALLDLWMVVVGARRAPTTTIHRFATQPRFSRREGNRYGRERIFYVGVAIAMPLISRPMRFSQLVWPMLLGFIILLGIGFRVSQLDAPVFWVDEVATATRVSGYTQAE